MSREFFIFPIKTQRLCFWFLKIINKTVISRFTNLDFKKLTSHIVDRTRPRTKMFQITKLYYMSIVYITIMKSFLPNLLGQLTTDSWIEILNLSPTLAGIYSQLKISIRRRKLIKIECKYSIRKYFLMVFFFKVHDILKLNIRYSWREKLTIIEWVSFINQLYISSPYLISHKLQYRKCAKNRKNILWFPKFF